MYFYLQIIDSGMHVNPKLLIDLSPPLFHFSNHKFVFEICESVSIL